MDELTPPHQNRALERIDIGADVDVYDRLRDVYLGRLVNIHEQGLMIVGDVAVDEDRLYTLDLHFPLTLNGRTSLQLGVDCLWARSADYQDKHWAGFAIIDLSPDAAADIRLLVAHLGQEAI